MRRRVLSIVLAASLVVSAAGWGAVPAQAQNGVHAHERVLLQTGTIIGNGHYYLNEDWKLDKYKTINVNGNAIVCLNGHKIDANGKGFKFNVQSNGSLTICDCSKQVREGYIDAQGLWKEGAAPHGTMPMNLQGGVITGVHDTSFIVLSAKNTCFESGNIAGNTLTLDNSAIFRTVGETGNIVIKGGKIIGNNATAIVVQYGGSVSVEGGQISHNHAPFGTILNKANLLVSGGKICDNLSANRCGGINNIEQGTLQLKGQPLFSGNIGKDGRNDIYLENGCISVVGVLQNKVPIGVSMSQAGPFTQGWQTHMAGMNPSDYFYAEKSGEMVALENGEVALTAHSHNNEAVTEPWDGNEPAPPAAYLARDLALTTSVAPPDVLCLSGHSIESSAQTALTLEAGKKLALFDCPKGKSGSINGAEAAILLHTKADAATPALDVSGYGGTLNVKEADPEASVGGCAVKGQEGKVALVNPGYHLAYKDGAYVVARDSYAITYKDAGDVAFSGVLPQDAPIEHQYGIETSLLAPTKEGYVFGGWYTDAACSGSPLTVLPRETMQATTLYAKWTADVKAPVITEEPTALTLTEGEAGTLQVKATAASGDTLSYQWYEAATAEDAQNGIAISGATSDVLQIDGKDAIGTKYYYCVVTASRDGVAKSSTSKVVAVTVKKPAAPPAPPVENPGETVTNPDGSVTTTVTKHDGTIVSTTKHPNGDKLVLETLPNGKINVTVIGTPSRLVTVPLTNPHSGMVAMVTDKNGGCRLEKHSVVTEKGLALMVQDGDSIEVVDKSVAFVDVGDAHWAKTPIDFACARGLLVGVDDTHFAPSASTTRAMIWSILARVDGANLEVADPWYAKSREWAMANGVSDGTMPNEGITREQLASMLYRYAGSPVVNGSLDRFADAGAVSEWALAGVQWAVEEGIINGTSADTLSPQDGATRAQTAAVLERFIAWQLGIAVK